MNSAIQLLSSIPEFRAALRAIDTVATPLNLAWILKELIEEISQAEIGCDSNPVISLDTLWHFTTGGNGLYSNTDQQCAIEFLGRVLRILMSQFPGHFNPLFESQFTFRRSCVGCGVVSSFLEKDAMLWLAFPPIGAPFTIERLFEFNSETSNGEARLTGCTCLSEGNTVI
jgi:hypothetical protein